MDHPVRVVPCVGAVARDADGRLLLVRRGHSPQAGRWSLPGGRVEPGETAEQALVREVWEGTGYLVAVGDEVGRVQIPTTDPFDGTPLVYEVADHACAVTDGQLRPGDDAADARWVHPVELSRLPLTDGLVDALTDWGLLPG